MGITEDAVRGAMHGFAAALKIGDFEAACRLYAKEAVCFNEIDRSAPHGRDKILNHYRKEWENVSRGHHLQMYLIKFMPSADGAMASCIFDWRFVDGMGNDKGGGWAVKTFVLEGCEPRLLHDVMPSRNN